MTRLARLAPLAVAALTAALAVPLGGLPVATATAVAGTCASANLTVAPLHGPVFYTDLTNSPVLSGAYAGYRITDTSGAPRQDLWVKLSGFTGGSVALGTGQADAQQIPTLPANAGASRFFYLNASALSANPQNHTVSVYSGRPDLGGSLLCSQTGGFLNVQKTLAAAANKLTGVSVGSGGTPTIGAQFTITVEGDTGQVGAGTADDPGSFWMSPSAVGTWPADAYRLVGTTLSFDGVSQGTDILRVANTAGPDRHYVATYTFRAIGFTATNTAVIPVQQIASGTQIKHTALPSLETLPAITSPVNDLTLASSASTSSLPIGGGDVTYTVRVRGTAGAVLDDFVITPPSGATFKPGSAHWGGHGIGDLTPSGSRLIAQGPFTLPGGGADLDFTLTLDGTPGDRPVATVARLGSTSLDATVATDDDSPASSTVHVASPPSATDDTVTVTPDQSLDVDVLGNDTDADGDPLTLDSVSDPEHGSTQIVDGIVRYTPDEGFVGEDSFTYTVLDGTGGTSTATVHVTVSVQTSTPTPTTSTPEPTTSSPEPTTSTPEPTTSTQAPTLDPADDTAEVAYDASVLIDVLANDTDGAAITDVSAPAHGSASLESGKVRYTPDGTHAGTDTFTYGIAVDGTPAENPATVTVTVTAADLEVADDAATASAASIPLRIDVLDNDSGENVRVTDVTDPARGEAAIAEDGTVTYTSGAGVKGRDGFDYTATDALGRAATGHVTVTVPNAAPTMEPIAARSLVAGSSITVPVSVADANGDTLAVTAPSVTGSAGAAVSVTVSGTGGSRSARITAGQVAGQATVTLRVSDGDGGVATRTAALTILPAAPVGVIAGVIADPAAVRALSKPVFVGGKPVSRVLSTRIDSQVTWRKSATAGVTSYRVVHDGVTVCTPAASQAAVQSCTAVGRAIERGDDVRVIAVVGALSSAASIVPVAVAAQATSRLLAVVYFPSGEFKLDATATAVLGVVAGQARQYGLSSLALVGHTDSDGTAASNLTLSRQRAGQVRDWMRSRYSWVAGSAAGRGEVAPAVSNGTPAGKAANRRVEIYVG